MLFGLIQANRTCNIVSFRFAVSMVSVVLFRVSKSTSTSQDLLTALGKLPSMGALNGSSKLQTSKTTSPDNKAEDLKIYRQPIKTIKAADLVASYAGVFSVVTQRSSLRDDTKNACVGGYRSRVCMRNATGKPSSEFKGGLYLNFAFFAA